MPLLFVVAGISAKYALEKRTYRQYVRERFFKLFVPLVSGLLLIVPVQTYYAERFHNGYTGGYFEQYGLFFTKQTDLSGYTGGFTPGQLWFILYLFVISLAELPFIIWYKKSRRRLPVDEMTVPLLLPLFLLTSALSLAGDIGGKSPGYYFAFFILGYLVLSGDPVQRRLAQNRWALFAALAILTAARLVLINQYGIVGGILPGLFTDLTAWLGILAFIGLGAKYLEVTNKLVRYFTLASFPIYIIHQSALVAVAYYAFKLTPSVTLQIIVIITGTLTATLAVYELVRHIPGLRFLFGIKPPARVKAAKT
jgi:hypothetical protein